MQNERTALGLPDVAPDSLLAVLREVTGARALRFAEAPCRLGAGGEAVVDAFRLAGAPSGFDGPLVVRRLMPLKDASQIQREAVVHRVLAQQGYPVPRVFAAEVSSAALGAPFLIAERLPGKVLLQEIMRPGMVAAHPMRIPRIVYEALVRVPPLLGALQARLHALDPAPLRQEIARAGFGEDTTGFDGRLRLLTERIDTHALGGLAAGLDCLRANRPAGGRDAICHGDFVFTNVCVENGRATGVFDWSSTTIAAPAFDIAATLARLKSHVPGMPAWLGAIARAV